MSLGKQGLPKHHQGTSIPQEGTKKSPSAVEGGQNPLVAGVSRLQRITMPIENSAKADGYLKLCLPAFVALSVLGNAPSLNARDYTVVGGLTVGYEGYSRQYEIDETGTSTTTTGTAATIQAASAPKDDRYNRFRTSPLLDIKSVAARDELLLHYSPSFRYDFESYDHDVDHDLSADFKRFLTENWQLKLSEKYLMTDRVEDQNSSGTINTVELSSDAKRRKYWTNNVKATSEYKYWEDSLFTLGYDFSVLENMDVTSDSNYENYDRHEILSSIAHRFNSNWRFVIDGSYVRGLYDTVGKEPTATDEEKNKDLIEYRGSTTLESSLIEHHPLSLSYKYFGVDYDDEEQKDAALHDVTLGWQWQYSKDLSIGLGGGPSYQKTEDQDGNWGYNANMRVKYSSERSSLELLATRGYDWQNFSGIDRTGLREYWQSRLTFNYKMFQDLSFTQFFNYRYEDQDEFKQVAPTVATLTTTGTDTTTIETEKEVINRQIFRAGTNLDYSFWQWYTASLSYEYVLQDSEKKNDSYDEHRLMLTLSMKKDLFNW